jgi:hypothetical protein
VIRKSAIATHGGAGPSGGDADQRRRMCAWFGDASVALCEFMGNMAIRLATQELNPTDLEAFLAKRLIPLDKYPGYCKQ